MKIVHRISFRASELRRRELREYGIEPVYVDHDFISVDLLESSPAWHLIDPIIGDKETVDIARTEFSKKELANATFLRMVGHWHYGYPQPEDNYLHVTYNIDDYCSTCGIGAVQNQPFQMSNEPNWCNGSA